MSRFIGVADGGGHSYGIRYGDECSDQEWERTLAMVASEKEGIVVDEEGKIWRDPGVGNTKPGDGSPFRAAEFDKYLAEVEAEKQRKKAEAAEKRLARKKAREEAGRK